MAILYEGSGTRGGYVPPKNQPKPAVLGRETGTRDKPRQVSMRELTDQQYTPQVNAPVSGGFGPAQPGPDMPKEPTPLTTVPDMSDGVRELLNAQNWQLPTEANKKAEMPATAFEKGGITDLKQHDYTITPEEWDRIKGIYSSPTAGVLGYQPPAVSVDDNMPMMKLGEQESAALTWEAYDALSGDQRAAVDYNTLLVKAREKDLGRSSYLSDEDRASYDSQVTKLFGADRGSDTLAPATVDLLSRLNMDLVGQDLDEYLSLERAVDTTELMNFKFSEQDVKTLDTLVNGESPSYQQVRAPENLAAVDAAAVQKAQQVIKTAVQNPAALTYDFNTAMFGPSADMQLSGQPLMGFGDETTKWTNPNDAALNSFFQKGLGALGAEDPSTYGIPAGTDPMSWLLGDLREGGGDDQEQQQFLDYIQGQVDLIGQYGTEQDATLAALISKRAGLGG